MKLTKVFCMFKRLLYNFAQCEIHLVSIIFFYNCFPMEYMQMFCQQFSTVYVHALWQNFRFLVGRKGSLWLNTEPSCDTKFRLTQSKMDVLFDEYDIWIFGCQRSMVMSWDYYCDVPRQYLMNFHVKRRPRLSEREDFWGF